VQRRFHIVVNIVSRGARSGLAIAAEHSFKFGEQIGFRTEMTEVLVALVRFLGHVGAHFGAIVTVESVAFDEGRNDILATENLLEGPLDGRRTGA
jgi:hypothetical protein